MFWTRLGGAVDGPTSGTVEEVNRFLAARKTRIVYFSDREAPVSRLNEQELKRVRDYRQHLKEASMQIGTFQTQDQLKSKILADLVAA